MEATMSLREILDEVCKICEVPPEDVLLGWQTSPIIRAKHIFCWAALTSYSSVEIGKFLDKSHAGVLRSRKVVYNMIFTRDPFYFDKIKLAGKLMEVVSHEG